MPESSDMSYRTMTIKADGEILSPDPFFRESHSAVVCADVLPQLLTGLAVVLLVVVVCSGRCCINSSASLRRPCSPVQVLSCWYDYLSNRLSVLISKVDSRVEIM